MKSTTKINKEIASCIAMLMYIKTANPKEADSINRKLRALDLAQESIDSIRKSLLPPTN